MSSDFKKDCLTDKDEGSKQMSNSSSDIKGDEDNSQLSRLRISESELEKMTAAELRSSWRLQDSYIDSIENSSKAFEGKVCSLIESEEKLKLQLSELSMREKALVRRLAAKEQAVQEFASQLSELKGAQMGTNMRNCLLDPTVNLLVQKLRQEVSSLRTKLEDTQNELSAWKFTPDSNTGKRLMAKCRLLYQENEELGKMISSGRLAKLEGELALQKSFSEEVKKSQSEMDELLQDLDEDVEGMQSTIYYLQKEMKRSRDAAAATASVTATASSPPASPPPQAATAATTVTATSGGGPTCNGLNGHSVVRKRTAQQVSDDFDDDDDDDVVSSGGATDAKKGRPPSPTTTPPPPSPTSSLPSSPQPPSNQFLTNGTDPPH